MPLSRHLLSTFLGAACASFALSAQAAATDCVDRIQPQISFISFKSPNLAAPGTLLTIKGKLSVPTVYDTDDRCFKLGKQLPAVLILHGSGGVDSRGDYYQDALNAANIATLQIDMWEARGVVGLGQRPALPILTHPDAFSALAFLSQQPNIAPARIGVLGFSWGGVMALATAEKQYAGIVRRRPHLRRARRQLPGVLRREQRQDRRSADAGAGGHAIPQPHRRAGADPDRQQRRLRQRHRATARRSRRPSTRRTATSSRSRPTPARTTPSTAS